MTEHLKALAANQHRLADELFAEANRLEEDAARRRARPSGWCAPAEQEGPDEVAACYLTCRGEP